MQQVQNLPWSHLPSEEVRPGIHRQRLDTERMTVIRYTYSPGSIFPAHSHPEEQVTMVLSGEIEFEVGDKRVRAESGSVLVIPSGVVHGARVLGETVVDTLNVLSPRRTRAIAFAEPDDGSN